MTSAGYGIQYTVLASLTLNYNNDGAPLCSKKEKKA